ncbi:hypothetical protein BASA50_002698 [Batrachochytrium salamandrivorans]|uniref:ADF-H domain-containing protein n=1 Tax=Batrachochytrium salamandrivorans TaxID=1357716 RepID=A0ABQ8FNG6_9FUNG|nr:hypothetical protein BASA50_002698 [Batrachochytrium salamandrivorans]
MSHQTGIKPSQDLVLLFGKINSPTNGGGNSNNSDTDAPVVRAIRSSIVDESIVVTGTLDTKGTWEQDFTALTPWLDESTPCYILYRMDTRVAATGIHEWAFLQYVPDTAKVRDKMMYAATKSTLTKELGDAKFTDTVYATTKDDLSIEGYHRHVKHTQAETPLTEREIEASLARVAESNAALGSSARSSNAPGIAFLFTPETVQAFEDLKRGKITFITLTVDAETETTRVHTTGSLDVSEIVSKVDASSPYFIFVAVSSGSDYAFAYVSPPECKIRDRMLFAASRSYVLGEAETSLEVSISKKFEVDSVDEFVVELSENLDPSINGVSISAVAKPAFSKPARPGRK